MRTLRVIQWIVGSRLEMTDFQISSAALISAKPGSPGTLSLSIQGPTEDIELDDVTHMTVSGPNE